MESTQAARAQVRDPQLGDSAFLHQISQSVEQRAFLPRGIARRAPVQLHALEVPTEPLLASRKGAIKAPTP